MSNARLALPLLLILALAGCFSAPPAAVLPAPAHRSQPILAGTLHPAGERGFDALIENAVVSVAQRGYGDCSGTLVADRVVVTAFHCIITDVPGWYLGDGAVEPQISPADSFTVSVGPSRENPACVFDVETVHGHPLALPIVAGNIIDDDVAVLTLAGSVVESCPFARTAPLADPARDVLVVGDRVIVGGFGATDEALTQYGERRWAELEVVNANPAGTNFINLDVAAGFPQPGDSGGGVFVATSDGPVLIGISSTVVPSYFAAAKVTSFADFFREMAGPAWSECPARASSCADDATLLRCTDGAIEPEPCADGTTCVESEAGAACEAPAVEDQDTEPPAPGCAQSRSGGLTPLAVLAVAFCARRRRGARGVTSHAFGRRLAWPGT